MSFNLLVWKWSPDFETGAQRKKAKLKYSAVVAAFAENEAHPAMAEHDFQDFERALADEIGPEVVDGPYILERYACARVVNMPYSQVAAFVVKIGTLARRFSLTSAEM